jgi:hypothetical protein
MNGLIVGIKVCKFLNFASIVQETSVFKYFAPLTP